MADLNIPKLNMNSEKYIFKKNLSLRRKSIKRLFIESVFMFILSLFLVYLNYLIPNKILLLQKVPTNLYKSFVIFMDLFSSLYEIFLVIFIFISSIITFILLTGSFYRIFRIANRKQSLKKGYK
tara:strand:- start:453 stop:824 length:372 start_codon:yes stop_codon:yes gene_type:complete